MIADHSRIVQKSTRHHNRACVELCKVGRQKGAGLKTLRPSDDRPVNYAPRSAFQGLSNAREIIAELGQLGLPLLPAVGEQIRDLGSQPHDSVAIT